MSLRHSRLYIHLPHTDGERIADAVAEQMGSWRFIIIQSCVVATWILINIVGIILRFDPYPFILLNLLFSTQAAYAAPVIMMSQNRQAQKDRLRDDHEAAEVDDTYQIQERQLQILENQNVELAQQTEILQLLRTYLHVDSVVPQATPEPEPVLVPAGPPPAPQIVPAPKPAPLHPAVRARRGARK